jgi:hypothetical protein
MKAGFRLFKVILLKSVHLYLKQLRRLNMLMEMQKNQVSRDLIK